MQYWLACLMLFVLAGCSGLPTEEPSARADTKSPSDYISAAAEANNPEQRIQLLLKAVDAYQNEQQHEPARQLLVQLESNPGLTDAHRDQWLLLAMRGITETGNRRWARHLAGELPVEQFLHYPDPALQQRAAELQAQTYELAGKPLATAQTLVLSSSLAEPEQGRLSRIWNSLAEAPLDDIRTLSASADDFDLQGWLELALALRGPHLSLEEQSDLIREWQSRWPAHPAAIQLPRELELLASLPEKRPSTVVLTLPLSGPLASAGQAVREGFLAAYYQDQRLTQDATAVEIIDTHERDFSSIYAELLMRNPDLIIGPLRKEGVAVLNQDQRLPVPVLALNYLGGENLGEPAENLYQFGLSPDDEAREIAQRLVAQNRTNVLLFVPDSGWGQRVADAFQQAHEDRGGRVLAERRYGRQESLRDVVASAFGINKSRNRAIGVEETIGMDVEFEPRRRQDIDAIVLFADPAKARQFKPMFAFYYGGDLPVLGSSGIYEGMPEAGRDADLEGVRFTDIPWILAQPMPPLRQSLRKTFPALASQYDRLFALGADAYLLSSRLPLLEQIPDSQVEGFTGQLTMTPDRQIRREQTWAVFRNGVPQPATEPEAQPQPSAL
jgi:outer membrane PBP1 activator LpoA protein